MEKDSLQNYPDLSQISPDPSSSETDPVMEYEESIATSIFRMSQRTLLTYLFYHYGKWWAIAGGVLLVSLIIATLISSDLRLLILALMITFILIPMVMAFLYINYALSTECAFNTLPHSVEFGRNFITLKIMRKEDSDTSHIDAASDNTDNYDLSGYPESSEPASPASPIVRSYPYSSLGRLTIGVNSLIWRLNGSARGMLYIPESALPDRNLFLELPDLINNKKKNPL